MSTEIQHGKHASAFGIDASMGPCSDEHGNSHELPTVVHYQESLQWGRALMSTEMIHRVNAEKTQSQLQWGRALMSTEMIQKYLASVPWSCFNGAVL